MKINASKKQKFYIKNVYVNQMLKPQKQNNINNAHSENSKIITDYNINQSINFNPKKIFFNKKAIKTLYQNFYSNNSYLLKDNHNFLSQKNINNRSDKKHNGKPISSGILSDSNISHRKFNQKNYEIINPFKERSNSENKINSFNRTYSFFNNKDNNNISYIKTRQNEKNKKAKKSVEKISINLSDISYQNIPTKLNNYSLSKENNSYSNKNRISQIKNKNNKRYFYQENFQKKRLEQEKNTSYSQLHKKPIIQMTPLSPKNNNNISITSPNHNNNTIKIKNDKNGRIKKYILNNLSDKRKIRTRQCFRQYLPPSSKSSGINNEKILNYDNYLNNNSPRRKNGENKYIENISSLNSPTIPSISSNLEDNSININKKYLWIKKTKKNNILYKNKEYEFRNNNYKKPSFKSNSNINQNIINLRNDLTSNLTFEGFSSNDIYKNEIREKLFEQSAIIIQSVFRGYLYKSKFETFLYNYKICNKVIEIIIKILTLEEKKKFFKYLELLKKQNLFRNKSNINVKSCKTFKLANLPSSPISEKERHTKHFHDLFLHKEIGERFNIIKDNKNKELEKKYKEELDGVNNKINKLIEENNKLKDINNKNKYQETKFKELSLDNKKKDNIINIITNDNQNLAKKLKIIKDKYNKLEIHNQINLNLNYNSENNKNDTNKLFKEYRNLYLCFLIYKKNIKIFDFLRRYFNRYRNIVNNIIYKYKNSVLLREQSLKHLIRNKRTIEYNILKKNFIKLYYQGFTNNKEIENRNNILKEKLKNIIINKEKTYKVFMKSYFFKFYYKGIISNLIEENNNYIKDKIKENNEKIKNLIISIDHRKDKHNFLIIRDCFDKWNLFSKLLSMKAITDEKKRKKRQKQRMKKKIENKSANKYLSNSNNILHLGKNNNINIINKDKDTVVCSEHSATTDFSCVEINGENKIDKIMKATDKLGEIFYKAALNYRKFDNKNKNITINKDIKYNNIEDKNVKNKDKKENDVNNENDNESDEDSGDSFGI
jgi:hypothetical protein